MEQEERSNAQTWSPSRVHCYLGSHEPLPAAREDRRCERTVLLWRGHPEDLGAEARLQAGLRSAQGTLSGLWKLV